MAGLVASLIEEFPSISGVYQVAGATISKFDLLCLLREAFRIDVEIDPDEEPFCDRSMRGDKFQNTTGHRSPPWKELVAQLSRDTTPYEEWRRNVRQAI
jgi:dTDP-4-dehydrorhamnose reductase